MTEKNQKDIFWKWKLSEIEIPVFIQKAVLGNHSSIDISCYFHDKMAEQNRWHTTTESWFLAKTLSTPVLDKLLQLTDMMTKKSSWRRAGTNTEETTSHLLLVVIHDEYIIN